MSTYRLYFNTGASCAVSVEADDFEEAADLAYDQLPSGLCAHCSGFGQSVGIELGGDWTLDDDGYEQDGEYIDRRSQQ